MDAHLAKKLQFKGGGAPYYVMGLPAALRAAFSGEGLRTELPARAATAPFILLFAENTAALAAGAPAAIRALAPEGKWWIAYAKLSSGIKTDMTRDRGWGPVKDLGWEPVSLVSLDETWSALRFKPMAAQEAKGRRQAATAVIPGIDLATRTITPPQDLEALFKKEPAARKKFESLAFSHRKEYIVWIESAKQPATRERRLQGTIDKLKGITPATGKTSHPEKNGEIS
ncbi:MAG TPA: YdeI/OmpD-associated family protein [Chitinophaga sp.]